MTHGDVTRAINKRISHIGHRGKFSVIGSFFAFRIDDLEGKVSCKDATEIGWLASNVLYEMKLIEKIHTLSNGYHMGGVVINWNRNF